MEKQTIERFTLHKAKNVTGKFCSFYDEPFYKIENYDRMTDFFMTITSSTDVWNFLWSKGGITAGRVDSDHGIFPYYTSDKVSDLKYCTGPFMAVKIITEKERLYWEPFEDNPHYLVQRNIYKNTKGSKVYFEEINNELQLMYRYGWMSSHRYGLVRHVDIVNLSNESKTIEVLDGCRNIMPACTTSDFQNNNSVLLDAYKKTDLIKEKGLALFAVSSIVTDKAEPSEALLANTCWFSKPGIVVTSEENISLFRTGEKLLENKVLKGKRPSCYLFQKATLAQKENIQWYQVFDTSLDINEIHLLEKELSNTQKIEQSLVSDIQKTESQLNLYIKNGDGEQETEDLYTCVHHKANVLFNIMRGGIIANNNTISVSDFLLFLEVRNKNSSHLLHIAQDTISYQDLQKIIKVTGNPQLERLFLEYLPLTFSRRHGDPSRPWNRFSIQLHDKENNPLLNYEGNWRDIFQNWEALAYSYPTYLPSMIAKFLNATTIDGFNPYKITRNGVDWEIPDPNNPWSNIGYWNDHQVIYLCKLLELAFDTQKENLLEQLNHEVFSASNVPYRLKKYGDIVTNPRDTIEFDTKLQAKIESLCSEIGSDGKLVLNHKKEPLLFSMTAKLLQIILTKLANYVPMGGIWLNTQRPEWNDANNALAGYGLSMVTVYYLKRMILFMKKTYSQCNALAEFTVPSSVISLLKNLKKIYSENPKDTNSSEEKRKIFVDSCGKFYEQERSELYDSTKITTSKIKNEEILSGLDTFEKHLDYTITNNKRNDGLYHSYNTLEIRHNKMVIHPLCEMLEGQVAILSSGYLQPQEVLDLYNNLKKSALREERQNSYILYPNKELPFFTKKNNVLLSDATKIPLLSKMLQNSDKSVISLDPTDNTLCHFNPSFRNTKYLEKVTTDPAVIQLYEKTFNHRSFTGRSGTFYAYEGLGSIYWHMVSKLLLAIQENVYKSAKDKTNNKNTQELIKAYYEIRQGLSFNKTPELYGAFPTDPYSHTPEGQGAKQPGMTGQVKEEIITRWGELGILLNNGDILFKPLLLRKNEFNSSGQLSFTRFGIIFTYEITTEKDISIKIDSGEWCSQSFIPSDISEKIRNRNSTISQIQVKIPQLMLM